ncbi:Stachyose synthase [Bienertia sinuspersici]
MMGDRALVLTAMTILMTVRTLVEKFRKYKSKSFFSPNSFLSYDLMRTKNTISRGIEIRETKIKRKKAIVESRMFAELRSLNVEIEKLKLELLKLLRDKEQEDNTSACDGYACKDGDYDLKAFTEDLRTKFKGFDDIWVWHGLLRAWVGIRKEHLILNPS